MHPRLRHPAQCEPVLAGEYVTDKIRAKQGFKPPQEAGAA
jgi:hypothetical protein